MKYSVGDTVYWEVFEIDGNGGLKSGIVSSITINKHGITYNVRYNEYKDMLYFNEPDLVDKRDIECAKIRDKIDVVKGRIKILCDHLKGLRQDYKEAKRVQLIEELAGLPES